MLFDRRTKRREGHASGWDEPRQSSVFPLAIPLNRTAGSIASVILLTGEKPGLEGLATVVAITFAVAAHHGIHHAGQRLSEKRLYG